MITEQRHIYDTITEDVLVFAVYVPGGNGKTRKALCAPLTLPLKCLFIPRILIVILFHISAYPETSRGIDLISIMKKIIKNICRYWKLKVTPLLGTMETDIGKGHRQSITLKEYIRGGNCL